MSERDLTRCIHCGAWINPKYGADSPAEHSGHTGTKSDPRAPGDYDNICDVCNYGKGLMTHHETFSARHASEDGGPGHFDVIEQGGVYYVYQEGYQHGEYNSLGDACRAAEILAVDYDQRFEESQPNATRTTTTEWIDVFVGADIEGDHCLYIKREDEYLSEGELDQIASRLLELLNSDERSKFLP